MTSVILPPIRERVEDYEELEVAISRFFREVIYAPLVREIVAPGFVLENSRKPRPVDFAATVRGRLSDMEVLKKALESGQVRFYRGSFTGSFSSKLSRALRSIGAEWDKKQGRFLIPHSELPQSIRPVIAASQSRFDRTVEKITERLSSVAPEVIAQHLDLSKYFDRTILKTNADISKTLSPFIIEPQLSATGRQRIAEEYSNTLHLPIQTFLRKETLELRDRILERSFAGYRYESLIGEIEKSYGVSQRKAKFLARQETNLLMAKFTQVRYQAVGSEEYIWGCVEGSAAHPVRHYHLLNKGKTFRWDRGAPINAKGERKNPKQDYNCRCFARPIIRF